MTSDRDHRERESFLERERYAEPQGDGDPYESGSGLSAQDSPRLSGSSRPSEGSGSKDDESSEGGE